VATGWRVAGTIRNQYAFTLRSVRVPVILWDEFGNVLDVRVPTLSSTTFGSHVTRSFSIIFPPAGISTDRVATYRSALR
jgi:hypothetical protein